MIISGLQKTTLLDYPGLVAATIFAGGCNFRCPFCHNSEILAADTPAVLSPEDVLAFLKKRAGILGGVCISGGEPTLQADLEDFILAVRKLGLQVKLDTNGSRPDILRRLCEKGLLDYVAMDIKAGKSGYARACGLAQPVLAPIEESVSFLLRGSVPYEFRTTTVRGIHTEQDFREIGPWIRGAAAYYLQSYRDSEQVLKPGFQAFTREELLHFAGLTAPYVSRVSLRGVD